MLPPLLAVHQRVPFGGFRVGLSEQARGGLVASSSDEDEQQACQRAGSSIRAVHDGPCIFFMLPLSFLLTLIGGKNVKSS